MAANGGLIRLADNLVIIEDVHDRLEELTVAEILAGTGTVTVYSDEAQTAAVTGAENLTISVRSGQTATPASFYAEIPNTVSLTAGSIYYVAATMSFTDVSASATKKLRLVEVVTAGDQS